MIRHDESGGARAGAVALAALLASTAAFADAGAEVFGSAPAVDHVRISPNGARVLAIASDDGKRGLATIDLAAGTITVALQVEARTELLDSCEWVSDERIVCAMYVFPEANGRLPYPRRRLVRLVAVDHDGGDPLALLDRPPPRPVKMGGHIPLPRIPYDDLEHALLHPLLDDPQHVLVAAPREATPYRSVYRVHVGNGTATRIIGWQAGIVFWHADREGRVRVGTGWYEFGNWPQIQEPGRGPTAMVADAAGRLQRLDVAELSARIGERELGGPRILGFSTNDAQLYYEARVGGADRAAVWLADAATLEPLRRIVSHPQQDVHAEAIAGHDCGVVGFMHPLPGRPFTWLDAEFGRAVEAAQRVGEGDFVAVTSMSSDCRRVVLAATDGLTRRAFYLLDRSTGALGRLGDQYPAAAEAPSQAQQRTVRYSTRDGLDLPMTLTAPAGEGLMPIVVLLDGSPGRRSTATLDTWPHFFASRGYAVAEPAFRGARGYGTAFHVAGLQARGAKLQEDVADAVAWLGEAGLGDAGRVCFIGRGRGGHFALAAALADTSAQPRPASRCAAAYAAMDVALTKRAEHNPFDGRFCNFFPCGDWMRWADPSLMRYITRWEPADERRKLNRSDSSLLRSPLVGAKHPGFPVLIHSDGRSIVHEKGSRRFRADLKDLGFFEQVAPVGSDDEVEFLAAAEALFGEVLHGSEATR